MRSAARRMRITADHRRHTTVEPRFVADQLDDQSIVSLIEGDERQIVFESGGGDEEIHIADLLVLVAAQLATDNREAFHKGWCKWQHLDAVEQCVERLECGLGITGIVGP
jgi:hypothetical protein